MFDTYGNLPHYKIKHTNSGHTMATCLHANNALDVAHGLSLLGVYRDVIFTVYRAEGAELDPVFQYLNGHQLPR